MPKIPLRQKGAVISNLLILFLVILFPITGQAYDPCDVENSFNKMAQSQCFRIQRPLEYEDQTFVLSSVLMTKDLAVKDQKNTMVLIPGGPGGDSQGLRMSLDQKDLLNAFWAHLNLNVVAYDPRGTGHSQLKLEAHHYPQEVFYTEKQVDDLKAVVDTISPVKPVILFAHSAGGNLAAQFAALYPDRVKGLILYSASIDTREIGLSNLRIFAKEFPFADDHFKQCSAPGSTDLKLRRKTIEKFLRQVLLLKRIQNIHPQDLTSSFYLKEFRIEMIKAIENDPFCENQIPTTLEVWEDKIAKLSPQTQDLVESQENGQFDPETHQAPMMNRTVWIRTAVICSEGIMEEEMNSELWLEGLNFNHDTCFGVTPRFSQPPSRDWLGDIKAPTLLLGGSMDPFQIPSAVKRNARAIENSKLKIFEGGGHESHLTHPMEFYREMESFLKDLAL